MRRRWRPRRRPDEDDHHDEENAAACGPAAAEAACGEDALAASSACRADDGWRRQIGRACLGWARSLSLSDAHLARLPTGAVHLKALFPPAEWEVGVLAECTSARCVPWSQHEKSEAKGFWVQSVLGVLARSFGVREVVETRVNVYRAGLCHAKPHHQDRNAFSSRAGDVTIGASFGASRALEFRGIGELDAMSFVFRQDSGDVFAFDSEVNRSFSHGIRREARPQERDRVSIVLWGYQDSESSGSLADVRPPMARAAPPLRAGSRPQRLSVREDEDDDDTPPEGDEVECPESTRPASSSQKV